MAFSYFLYKQSYYSYLASGCVCARAKSHPYESNITTSQSSACRVICEKYVHKCTSTCTSLGSVLAIFICNGERQLLSAQLKWMRLVFDHRST